MGRYTPGDRESAGDREIGRYRDRTHCEIETGWADKHPVIESQPETER